MMEQMCNAERTGACSQRKPRIPSLLQRIVQDPAEEDLFAQRAECQSWDCDGDELSQAARVAEEFESKAIANGDMPVPRRMPVQPGAKQVADYPDYTACNQTRADRPQHSVLDP